LEENLKEIVKETMIRLAEEHKKSCKGDCGISLFPLAVALKELGVELTDQERLVFA